ncbi:16S rRNA (guanine527-N7)-methyltransferase [Altererythrobacter atlanticus]|uniref:Ribosomal RNA small subunit methyltransferase G n=1 Tax=Croceibacterium atlanticum TaxID=1267766 RepID=A0A0F7KUP3_9SPHN|nr:16S rRNA (guanine(527)-N(7))-methyltransferase RsmG [Croceibacterium atlanticum]AKH43339.1 Ribosomal RNA small subunit methyltransferase G [Croceibacterium atlanticum]MBB5731955.1 16S rRNA (guanine527-N7)-methyltransferase [Croceibacterium atlanticum]
MINSEEAARAYCAGLADNQALDRLQKLADLVAEENERQNLVSNASLDMVWQRHLADSVQLVGYVSRETPGQWMDLGTGAGFPGLAIAAVRPSWEVLLVESRKRRVEWLERAIKELDLANCRVAGSRLEDVKNFSAGIISARAFAPLGKLLKLSARFSTRDTIWLLPKGRKAAQELAEQPVAIQEMFHVEPSRTDETAGILIGQGTPRLS